VKVAGDPVLAVIGGINVDLVVSGTRLPRAGETVTGGVFAEHQGGKGGNQAVAAARAMDHGTVVMVGAVGDDRFGANALEALRAEQVGTDHVAISQNAPTGIALIAVGPDGENQISVAPGANDTLEPRGVVSALEILRPDVLLASLEVPEAAVRAALEWARDHGVPTVLNPAPAHDWAQELVQLATVITPNEHELPLLGGIPSEVVIVETRGAEGVRIHRGTGTEDVPARPVEAVDTTGAGDCFNGVLAARLSGGRDLTDAVREGVVAGGLSVQVAGAREGMPAAGAITRARAGLFD
jgi:ribokinase